MLRCRLLLWQAHQSFLGSDFHQPDRQFEFLYASGHTPRAHPTFEAAVELANFFILMWLFKRKKFDGQVLAAYFILYGIARYFLEFIRDDPGRGEVFGGIMTGTQLISIGLVITGGLIWWMKSSPGAVPAHAQR